MKIMTHIEGRFHSASGSNSDRRSVLALLGQPSASGKKKATGSPWDRGDRENYSIYMKLPWLNWHPNDHDYVARDGQGERFEWMESGE